MNQIQNKYVILGSLCALLLTLVVGYAAFSTVLKIKGTSTINSNWDVRITDIQEGEKTGIASTSVYKEGDKQGQKIMEYEKLTATFSADLKSPGDSIEYNITVSNEGSLNAKLDRITVSEPDNEYITFETSGLKEGDLLESKTNKELKVKVIFKDVNINKMEPSTSKLTVTLDFSQADGSGAIGPESPTPEPVKTIVYRNNTNTVNIGSTVEQLGETTTDYKNIEYKFFIKHTIINDTVDSSELCFIKNDQLYCLQPNNLENNTTTLLNAYADAPNKCNSGTSSSGNYFSCFDTDLQINHYPQSGIAIEGNCWKCIIDENGSSLCRAPQHEC